MNFVRRTRRAGQRLFNAIFFADVPLADELDLNASAYCQLLRLFANTVPERLGESGIVEDPDISLKQKGRHPSRKTDLRQGSENEHPVPATQHTRDLVSVPVPSTAQAPFGIIASPVWFQLRRVRISNQSRNRDSGATLSHYEASSKSGSATCPVDL